MSDDEIENKLLKLGDLVDIEIGRREKRALCDKCSRPVNVCWCKSLIISKIAIKSSVIILQHPHEEKRCLRTTPILERLIPSGQYIELKGKRFSAKRFQQLEDILTSKNSIVLYPGKEAKSLDDLPCVSLNQPPYNIIILDGTWQQTKSMYFRNPCLRELPQVCLTGNYDSQYVIRTQPTEEALSTVETAAIALSSLENDSSIYSKLIDPLRLICHFQMNHGAVKHESKEHLILSGRYNKPMGKRTYKKLRKCGVKNENITIQDILDIAEKHKMKEKEKEINLTNEEANGTEYIKNQISFDTKTSKDIDAEKLQDITVITEQLLDLDNDNDNLNNCIDVER